MIRNLFLIQFIITIQKLLLNTAIGNKNFLDLNQISYTLTIWIQLFPSLIYDINQNEVFSLLQLKEDKQSFFDLQMVIRNSDFELIIKTQNREENFGIDLIEEKYQWITFLLKCDGQTLKYNILNPFIRSSSQENFTIQKTRIITAFTKILTLLIYDGYQETLDNDYFMINSFPYFDKHQFKVQNDNNLIEIVAYARVIVNYQYNGFYIAQFEEQNINILIVYEKKGLYFGKLTNQKFDQKFKCNYEIKEQLWMKYMISYKQMKMNIYKLFNIYLYIEIGDFQCKGVIDLQINQQKYINSMTLYNYGVVHQKILIINKYGQSENQIQFCYPGCQDCQQFQCLDHKQQIECSDIEIYNEQAQKCELIVSYLSVTQDIFIPRCKVGSYLVNRTCVQWYFFHKFIQSPSYQGFKCLECIINTEDWKKEKACAFSQIVYLQLIYQLFQKQGNLDYDIEDNHFRESRKFNFLQNTEYSNIFLQKSKDIHLIYYDQGANKNYCQLGYHYRNNKCIRIDKNCIYQYKSLCICNPNYTQIRNRCVRCQQNCKVCQFQTKYLVCMIPEENYFIGNSSNVVSCAGKLEQSNNCQLEKFKCQNGQFYDIANQSCIDRNFQHIQQNMIQYIQFNDFPQDQGLQYFNQNLSKYANYQSIQLRYLSAIEQLHQLSSFVSQDQMNIQDCDFTVYYRNIPYCLKAKQNYLVNDYNQLLYCPISKQCAYKYIINGIVQLTNRVVIIINDQLYSNFSEIIESITRHKILIKVIQFNILFQINLYDVKLDWGKIFYLEDKYYHQKDILFALAIQFEQNQYFLNGCDNIQVRFHQIILNNLNMSLGELCNKRSDQDIFELKLIGTYLILNNTNFYNIDKPVAIKLLNFTTSLLFNTKIINCTINGFLFIFDQCIASTITFRNIQIHNSILTKFLMNIIGANQVKFIETLITRTQIRSGICYVSLITDSLNILNMIFRLVQSTEARFIVLFSEYNSGNLTASDINFYNCDFHKTIILQAKQTIIIESMQFSNTRFNQSCIILSDRSEYISISQFKIQNITILNSYLLKIKSAKQVTIENLLISFRVGQLSLFPLFDIESQKCTFYGMKINNLDDCFKTNLFLLSRQNQIIIQEANMQGNLNETYCAYEQAKQNQHLFQINQAQFVSFIDVQMHSSLFCDLGFIYAEFQQVIIKSLELKNLILNQIQMQRSLMQFQPLNIFSSIDLESVSINQIILKVQVQHSIIQIVGFSSKVDITNFEIQDVNSSFRSNVFGVSNLFLFIEQFKGYQLRNMFILYSENCYITFNSSIISKVIDYANYSTPLLYITSNQYLFTQAEIHNVKIFELQNQFLFVQPQSRRYSLLLKNIELNINLVKSDIINFGYQKISYQQLVLIHNVIFNIKNYNIIIDFNLLKISSQNIEIYNVSVNQLTSGFLFGISKSIKIHNITINNPLSEQQSIFQVNQPDLKSMVVLSNIFITSVIQFQSKASSIKIIQRNSLIKIQNIHIQNVIQFSIIEVYQSDDPGLGQLQRKSIRDCIFNNMLLRLSLLQTFGGLKINMEDSHIINVSTLQILQGVKASFHISNSSLINCTSNKAQAKNNIYIFKSQVVDGQIILSSINFKQTYVLNVNQDDYERYYSQELQLFLSLNQGKSYFQNQFKDQFYQVLLKEGVDYLYLPSGQQLKKYEYLNIKQLIYEKLYDSISIVLKYTKQDVTYQCLFSQLINGIEQSQQDLNLRYGLNILDNLTFVSNPYQNQSIECILFCNYELEQSNLKFQVKTFPCQLGEYLFQNQCLVCDIDKNYYSVSYKATNCLIKDNSKIDHLKKGQIELLSNYWRYQLNNKFIEKCEDNCKGGWKVGDYSCQDGHIGAVCNECDIYNTRGQGSYGLDGEKCQICQFDYTLIIKGMLISFWQLLLAYMSYSTNSQISNQYLFNKINNRKLSNILDRQNINQVSIMLKLISNYLYALYLIKDNFYLGNYVDWSLNLFNNPNMVISPQLDCMLAELIPLNVSYSMLIYRFSTPFLVLNMFFVIYIVLICLKQQKYETKVILIIIYSIYMFNQQLILQSLIKHSSYKFYSNIAWVFSNLSIMYYSDSHKNMLYKLVIPLSICFWIIPLAIFIYLWKINKSSFKSQKQLGYIYREYNQNCYYWEMIRIYYNFFLMTILYVFNQKLFLTLLLCQTFILVTQYKQPYSLNNLNKIDLYILIFAQFSFILVFYGDKQTDILIRYSVILFCNILLFQHLIRQIMGKAKFAYEKDIILIEQKVAQKFPTISKYLDLEKKKQIKSKIQKLRSSVKLKSFILQSPILAQPTIILQGEIEMQEIK